MEGWVYIITNAAMPGLVKIGYSMKDPQLRARELNNTGSPFPYEVVYCVLVDNPRELEQDLHKKLQASLSGKEWFSIQPEAAVLSIRRYDKKILRERILSRDLAKSINREFPQINRRKELQRRLEMLEKRYDEVVENKVRAHRLFDAIKAEVLELHEKEIGDKAAIDRAFELRELALAFKKNIEYLDQEITEIRSQIRNLRSKIDSF